MDNYERIFLESRLETYQSSTQFLDLMLQRPQATESRASKECEVNAKLIGLDTLTDEQVDALVNKASSLEKTDKTSYVCMNYRGYPIIVQQDGPMKCAKYLALVEPEKNIICTIPIQAPRIGL